MTTFTAHFDGHVLVPDSLVNLPVNQPLRVSVMPPLEGADRRDEIDEIAWLGAASAAVGLDFLAEEPDLYSSSDGRPFVDQG
jgi:hypothetical protein